YRSSFAIGAMERRATLWERHGVGVSNSSFRWYGSPYGSLVWIGGPDRPPGARSPSVASLGYPDIPESHGNYGCPMNALRAGLADPSGGPQVWDRDRRDREMPDREIPGREGPDRG